MANILFSLEFSSALAFPPFLGALAEDRESSPSHVSVVLQNASAVCPQIKALTKSKS
jgi:hypothetical protein